MIRAGQDKIEKDYPKGAVPVGTIVRSKEQPELWGVIQDALATHLDMDGQEILSYKVRWQFPSNSSSGYDTDPQPTVADIMGLDFFASSEMEYDLTDLLNPNEEYNLTAK
jgi:hypothetical protein